MSITALSANDTLSEARKGQGGALEGPALVMLMQGLLAAVVL
jgi:hypothetical protein